MRETASELGALQELIDASFKRAGPHFVSIAGPGKRLNAAQVATHLQGMRLIVLGSASRAGRPLVGPLDAFFLHGRFWASTSVDSRRAKQMAANAAVSAVYFEGEAMAVTVHGKAALFGKGAPDIEEILAVMTEWYKGSPFNWGDIILLRIDPDRVLTFASEPESFAEA